MKLLLPELLQGLEPEAVVLLRGRVRVWAQVPGLLVLLPPEQVQEVALQQAEQPRVPWPEQAG